MPIALVANDVAFGGGADLPATTGALNTTGCSLLVVVLVDWPGATTAAVSDSKGNTWSRLTPKDGAGRTTICYVENPVVGTSHTFTAQGTNAYPTIAVLAFSGAKLSGVFDVQNGAVGAGVTSFAPGSITPSEDGEVLVFGLGGTRSGTPSVDVGTISNHVPYDVVGDLYYGVVGAYQIQTTATARNPSFSWSGSADVQAVIASFKAALVAVSGISAVTGFGRIAALGVKAALGLALITGSGAVDAAAYKNASGSASVSGGGAVVATVSKAASGAASVGGAGSIAAQGTRGALNSTVVSGSGFAAATGTKQALGTARVSGSGSVFAESVMLSGDPEWSYSIAADDLQYSIAANDLRYRVLENEG